MRHVRASREVVRIPLLVLAIALPWAASACSNAASASGDASLVVEVSSTGVAVENRTGTALAKGEVSLMPQGVPIRYLTLLPHVANAERRTFGFDLFRSTDGTAFRRGMATIRTVKVTATDIAGKAYEREVPFK